MNPIEVIHDKFIKRRRVEVLSRLLSEHLPDAPCSVLDIGCGDGQLAAKISAQKPLLSIRGIDTLVRPDATIAVEVFDGLTVPHADGSFDYCLLVDVLHHAEDPMKLLREAARVAGQGVLIKDHYLQGFLAAEALRFMDDAHNRRYGVSLTYNYWTPAQWTAALNEVGLVAIRSSNRLGLYPFWAYWAFERSLHFMGLYGPANPRKPQLQS